MNPNDYEQDQLRAANDTTYVLLESDNDDPDDDGDDD